MGCLECERIRSLFQEAIDEHAKLRAQAASAELLGASSKKIGLLRRQLLDHESSHYQSTERYGVEDWDAAKLPRM